MSDADLVIIFTPCILLLLKRTVHYTLLLSNFSTFLRPKNIHRGIGITLGTDLTAQSDGGERVVKATILIQMPNINLHTAMVFCRDELVCPGTVSIARKEHRNQSHQSPVKQRYKTHTHEPGTGC
jgi:hypothetical protein